MGEIQQPLTLGIEEGGLRSAEALLLARYYMFTQLYFHPVRRIYDIHLKDFLIAWRGPTPYGTDINEHLALTDNEILAAARIANRDPNDPAHEPASRILQRKHFRLLYERTPSDRRVNFEAERAIYRAAAERYGIAHVRFDQYAQRSTPLNFPVLMKDDSIQSSLDLSTTLNAVPTAAVDYVFIAPEHLADAQAWLRQHKAKIIAPREETE